MSKVIVFGGAGYIGSHTCKELKASGFDTVTFDSLSEGYADFVKWGDLIVGDVRNASEVMTAIEQVRPVAAIHFAAHAYVGESVRDPAKYYENNVSGSLNVVQAVQQAGNVPLVFSSSCAVYGDPGTATIDEDLPKAPINPYGRSKLMVEQILQDFSSAYDLRSVCLRYFNASGDDADGDTGEAHRDETHLIPRAILSALGKIDDFFVFGDDYDTPDGTAVRDYIHVTDLARAHVAACRYLLDGGQTDQFNVGVGHGYSVLDIVNAVSNALATEVPHQIKPRRAGDPPKLVADPAKIRRRLGFETRHSDLKNIIETAVAWHQKDWVASMASNHQRAK
ncbi:MAG: UDP-glucose 4-epimerase GalE [Hoeflea sp.]|uniref:UDP-glucose 4-epimerase GalE n=1 Tax=Hoeflea sp. TaxID=1940281 RepID=UPI003EF85FB5